MICSPHRPDLQIGILIRIKYEQKTGGYQKTEKWVLKIQVSIHENMSIRLETNLFFYTQTIVSCSFSRYILTYKQTRS